LWAGCIKARSISPSWSPQFRGTPVVESQTTRGFLRRSPEPHSGTTFNNYKFMKPTPQISHNQNARQSFPLTDYNYQATADAKVAGGEQIAKPTGFHRLSSEFFGAEAYRDYVINFLVFTVLGVITGWPIILSIVAVARMARGY
jgi:hypothetical protein